MASLPQIVIWGPAFDDYVLGGLLALTMAPAYALLLGGTSRPCRRRKPAPDVTEA